MKNLNLLAVLSLIVLSVFLCCQIVYAQMAPDFTLTDIDGNVFSLSDFRGKVVLLDFFATWWGPCRAEMPHLKALNEKFGEELVIISISVDPNYDSVERLKSFRQDYNITWTLARDTINVQAQYNVTAIPTLYIIDQNGYVRFHHVGLTEEDALTTEISQIVPEFPTSLPTIILFIIIGLATLKLKYKLTKIGKQQH